MIKITNQVGDDALRLCASNLLEPSNACIKHIHNWRKTYFDSRGIDFPPLGDSRQHD